MPLSTGKTASFLKKQRGAKSKARNVGDFPDELLLKIFHRLPFGDLHRCSFVCKRWRRVAEDDELWRVGEEGCVLCGGRWGGEGSADQGVARGEGAADDRDKTISQLCYFCSKKSKTNLNTNSNNGTTTSVPCKESFVDACRRRRAQMLRSRLKVASVFSRNRIGIFLRDLDVEFEMWMKKKIGSESLVFRAEKRNIFHHGQSTTVRFLPIDFPPLSTISSISFVVLLPLFLPNDYSQKPPPPINAPISPSSSSSSSSSSTQLTQRARIALLNASDLEPPVRCPDNSPKPSDHTQKSSPSSSSTSDSIVYKILQNRQPFGVDDALAETDILAVRNVSSTLLAFWREVDEGKSKADDSLAFVSVNLHHHRLIPICLQSTLRGRHASCVSNEGLCLVPHEPYLDDLDPKFGLHGFDCIVELRHQRKSLWYHMFQGIFCREEIKVSSEYISLSLIRASHNGDSVILPEAVNFPWKTDLFTGKIPNLGILDLSLRDEFKKVIFEVSSPIEFIALDPSKGVAEGYFLDMNVTSNGSGVCGCSGDPFCGDAEATKVWRGVYSGDPRGQVVMDICNNYEFGENRTKVVNLEIGLKKPFFNTWFGTKY